MSKKEKLQKASKKEPVEFDLEKFLDSAPATKWDSFIWWICHGIWQRLWSIFDIPRYIGYFFQRGLRGYSRRDLWNFDYYLTGIILNGLVEFKANMSGYPSTLDPSTGEYSYDEDRWKKILSDMIDGFALLKKCQIGEEVQYGGHMTEEHKANAQSDERWKKFGIARYTTKEEEEKIRHAFDLLRDNFWSLVD